MDDQERAAQAVALQIDVPNDPATPNRTHQRKPHSAAPWTTADVQLIADNLGLSNAELGIKLGRTADAVNHKRRALLAIQDW